MPRVAIAMSGGVDSSVAAALLVEEGHTVVGVTLQLWDYGDLNEEAGHGRCCSPADVADARDVAARLGIRHYVFDHGERFRREIVEPFVGAYRSGLTPSPCIACNRKVKFDLLWETSRALGADVLATGHYARLEHVGGRPHLRKGRDTDKDQSYFLFDVPAPAFDGVRFPLGGLTKPEARKIAAERGLPVAGKADSYELCFIPDGDKNAFFDAWPGESRPGEIVDSRGRALGVHDGLHRFTVGQRRGLGVGGAPHASGERVYVLSVDADDGRVVVGTADQLSVGGLVARECNWLAIAEPSSPFRAAARIRHRHPEVPATITPVPGGRVRVDFDADQRAVAPGQGVAFYDGELLLGGGWIERPTE